MNLYQQKDQKWLSVLLTVISVIPAAYISFPVLSAASEIYDIPANLSWVSLVILTAMFSVVAYSCVRTFCWIANGFEDVG